MTDVHEVGNENMGDEDDEIVSVTGYAATRVDCDCGWVNYFEGDIVGTTVECEDCGQKMCVDIIC